MRKRSPLFLIFFLAAYVGFSQSLEKAKETPLRFFIEGSVRGEVNYTPISGVEISTDKGAFVYTNSLGEFKIKVALGDELVFRSSEFETVRYTVVSKEDVDVFVRDYEGSQTESKRIGISKKTISLHKKLVDSAIFFKKTDIKKSIDFITKSIAQLGKRGNKIELSKSLSVLGEIYVYHKQYDLAITNFKDALDTKKSNRTAILLGQSYLLNKDFENAKKMFQVLIREKRLSAYQKTQIYEGLGEAYSSLNRIDRAVENYKKGLKIAEEARITPKITDLNSKIADAYAKDDRLQEAELFYGNSLELANMQAPLRAVEEKEKVADFYSKKNLYEDEIVLRKKSLVALEGLAEDGIIKTEFNAIDNNITKQRINYKIANAYIAQDKLDEAIPYLEESIEKADIADDLIVQKDATRKLYEVYENKGDYTKALEMYKKYVEVVDTLYIRKDQEISRAARFSREINTKQNRITGLEKDRELSQSKYSLALSEQQLIQEYNARQRWIIYALVLGMFLLGVAAYFFYRSNKQQKLANNLLALKSLRSQMNPHFIFNALNSVNNYIAKSDERSANRYLSNFSTLMRAVLENSEEDFISLSKELKLLELYVGLEHTRFPDKFAYEIVIDERIDVEAFQIPPMLLQPYIENAIWHGLRYKEEKGFLKIDLKHINQERIRITISDNGIGREKSAALKTVHQKKQKSKGMGNIKKRIAILNEMYKDKVDVFISDLQENKEGTVVVLNLKKD
ncbi:MAG: histidine kinase [Cellulophaga sp.]